MWVCRIVANFFLGTWATAELKEIPLLSLEIVKREKWGGSPESRDRDFEKNPEDGFD